MELPTGKKPGGRPPTRKVQPGDRVPLSLRVTPAIKKWVDGASKASGRSQSQEVEFRLERTMAREALLTDALALRHGVKGAAMMMVISQALRHAEQIAAHFALSEGRGWSSDWLDDPRCYEAAADAITTVLKELHPSRQSITRYTGPPLTARDWERLGEYAAHVALVGMFMRDADGDALVDSVPGKRGKTWKAKGRTSS